MRNVRFHHIRGEDGWLRQHHFQTAIDGGSRAVRLASDEELNFIEPTPAEVDRAAWHKAHTGGALILAGPVRAGCAPWGVMVGGEDGPLLVTEKSGAEPTRPELGGRVTKVARDGYGRLWFMRSDLGECRLYDFANDAERGGVMLPEDATADHLTFDATGAYLVDAARATVWYRPDAGDWSELSGLGDAEPVSACTLGAERVAVVAHHPDGHRLWLLRAGRLRANFLLPNLGFPMHCVGAGDNRIVVADLRGAPGSTTRFWVFSLGATLAPVGQPREVHAFDGRALVADADGALWATTARGLRKLYGVRPRYATRGGVETVALDSGRFGCTWHRVFVDACLPEGTSIRLFARAADEPYPAVLTPEPSPPAAPPRPADMALDPLGSQAPLGSTTLDEEGWQPVGMLDERRAFADMPWPPLEATDPMSTFEGLIKTPPGRYLWLRVELVGTSRRSPQLYALRASYPRPSLLQFLPPYWRSDDAQADQVERFLALFEAELTQLDERVGVLPHLFDPRLVPADTLDWLGSFVAMSFDRRLPEHARRELLLRAIELYQTRGTVGGLELLGEVIAGVPVHLLEGFRLRRRSIPVLGEEDADLRAVLDEGLQLGSPPPDASDEASEEASEEAPNQDYYRRFAHRFTVVVAGSVCADRLDALDDAIEAWKPAHTAHTICALTEGMAPGVDAYVGVGSWVGQYQGPRPTTLDDDAVVLGVGSTLGIWSGTPRENITSPREENS